jgi:hypothetical protein
MNKRDFMLNNLALGAALEILAKNFRRSPEECLNSLIQKAEKRMARQTPGAIEELISQYYLAQQNKAKSLIVNLKTKTAQHRIIIKKKHSPMSKPIGFYTSYTPGDGSSLEQLQEQYGSYLEKMTTIDKMYLASAIASQIYEERSRTASAEVIETFDEIVLNLPSDDQLGILEALVNQIRYTPGAELPPKD